MAHSTVTITDVARHAGVSTMTVSRALNNTGYVAEGTRQRVLAAVENLGYVVNASARSLKGGRTNVLGMVVGDLSLQFFTEIVRGASDAARDAGLNLLLYTTASRPEQERSSVAALTSGLSDGLIIVLPRNPEAYLKQLEASRVPVVLINHREVDTHLPSVGADNYEGARAAAEHLVALGHRRIGFITGTTHSDQSHERERGYREVLEGAGLEHLVVPGDFTQPRGFAAAHELLALREPPTAVFAGNDLSAFGVIEAVKDRGLSVPGDVSVVGFDDIPMASQVHPALTTVRHPLHDLGEAAVRLLLRLLSGLELRAEEAQLELASELIVRASTAPPAERTKGDGYP